MLPFAYLLGKYMALPIGPIELVIIGAILVLPLIIIAIVVAVVVGKRNRQLPTPVCPRCGTPLAMPAGPCPRCGSAGS